MDIQAIINQMIVLFILIALGYFIGKTSLLTAEGVKALSRIVLYIALPCTVLNSVMSGDLDITGAETAIFTLTSLLATVLHLVIAFPAVRLLGADKGKRGIYMYMAAFGNVANMGFPVTIAILGTASAFYVSIYNIPYVLICYSLGIMMVSGKSGGFNVKKLLNPALIAGVIAVMIVVTGLKTPGIIVGAVGLISGVTTPGAMLIIGASLSRISFKDAFSDWRLYPVALLKLIIMPVIIWLIFRPFVTNDMALGVLVILSGMASGAMATIFAIEYGGDERAASSGVFLTTLLSCVTIPLVAYFLLA